MTAALATLNPGALVALASCEDRIERGLKTFIDVGQALAEIRDSRLYKGTHDTFESYLEQRWNMSRSYAHRMIAAAEVVLPMGNIEGQAPTNERQTRALAAVPEPERAEVWREAVEQTGGKPTAKAVTEIAKARTAPTPTPEPTESPLSTAPVGSGSTSPEPERHLSVLPTPEQVEAQRMEEQRVQIVDRARRRAPRLVPEIRDLITEVMSGMNLGETDLITPQTIADIRALVDALEARMEATR